VRSVENSLRRLRVDAVDIVQIHNGPVSGRPDLQGRDYKTLWIEDYLRPGGALEGLRRLLASGKARYAGLIARGNDAGEIGALLKTGLLHLVNVPLTLLNPTAGHARPETLDVRADYGNVIAQAQAAGAGIAVFSPLAGGLLTDGVIAGRGTHPLARPKDANDPKLARELLLAGRFREVAAARGMSVAALAYKFILTHPGVSTVVGGFSSAQQLEETVASAGEAGQLSDEAMSDIRRVWDEGRGA